MNLTAHDRPQRRIGLGLVLAGSLALGTPTASAQVSDFDLVHLIPSDCFMVSTGRHNPEQDFLDAHWAGVWGAFRDSGILEDMVELVGGAGDPQMLELVSGYVEASGALCRGVDWDGLGAHVVFGQRLNPPVTVADNITIGENDYIFLMRVDDAEADELWGQLTGWADGMFGLVALLAGVPIEFERGEDRGVATSVLDARSIFGPGGAPIELSFLRHGDVLGVVFGTDVRDGVIDLMIGAEGATAISSRPGFREAFAGLPDPEDGLDYVDIVALRGQVDQMVGVLREVMAAEMRVPPYGEGDGGGTRGDGGGGGMVSRESLVLNMINQVFDMGLEALAMFDYTASVRHTDGLATYTTSVTVLARDVEDNRFFPLLATGRPVEDFVAHLPATTTGYSVSGGTDTEGLYDFVLGLVGDFGPMGQLALGYWEAMQEQVGFDLRRDVLSWIDGEQISVDFQLDGKAHWLSRMKVTDEAMAAEKLDMVLGMVPDLMDMAAEANPMVMMLGVTVTPTRDPRFEGFHEVGMAMAGESMLVGVRDGAMIFASAGDAIEHCMAVASGTAEGIATNERMMALAMLPAQRGAGVNAASFSDHSGTAAAFAEALAGVSMMGGMVTMGIEEPEVREVVGEVIRILGKLGPVVQALDFYRASSSVATFDGRAWHTRTVTHYAPARGTGTAPAGR